MPASQPNPKVNSFFRKARQWRGEMEKLREILLACGLTEELKWSKPCYSHADSNVVLIAPFKNHCVLIVCRGALIKDPKGILIKPGENTQAARQIRFTSLDQVEELESTLKACMREAMALAKAGIDVAYKKTSDYEIPTELEKKMAANPALKKAFTALTPGRQRAYIIQIAAAKQSATRDARIAKYTPQILKGIGLQDEYRATKK